MRAKKPEPRPPARRVIRATAYVRVSSRAQGLHLQQAAIAKAAAARGETIGFWYSETASGRTLNRPALAALRADVGLCMAGARIYVWRLDRLTRSGVADTFALVSEIRRAGVELVSVSDGLVIKPADDVASDVMIFALGLAAKIERVAINERISAARTRIEAKGGAWGRPSRMTPAEIARAFVLRHRGATLREIAIALKIPKSTIARTLSHKGGAKRAA
jgi:DNA invertase Pin-like site-specific DNA recombinase